MNGQNPLTTKRVKLKKKIRDLS